MPGISEIPPGNLSSSAINSTAPWAVPSTGSGRFSSLVTKRYGNARAAPSPQSFLTKKRTEGSSMTRTSALMTPSDPTWRSFHCPTGNSWWMTKVSRDFHVKHNWVVNFTWNLPGPKLGGVGRFLGGWELAGIAHMRSGNPLTVFVQATAPARFGYLRWGQG